jgi:hypothetical protein
MLCILVLIVMVSRAPETALIELLRCRPPPPVTNGYAIALRGIGSTSLGIVLPLTAFIHFSHHLNTSTPSI